MKKKNESFTYASTGVRYNLMDAFKRLAQLKAKTTSKNLSRFGMKEVKESRGESAYVWEEQSSYRALVIEGLGTKNIIADEVRKYTGKTYYDTLAQDTVAMIVNDLIVVGADPQVINAYFAVGNSRWFSDKKRLNDLVSGWAHAVQKAGAVWGGGETPTLSKVIEQKTIDLSGSAVGIIKPKSRLVLGNKLTEGDAILVIESSGIHANGLTLVRAVASKLSRGYKTKLADKKTFGETLLTPTHIYCGLIRDCFEAGIHIHYMVNITGHGWRKLMRAKKAFSYIIDRIPSPSPVFQFIQEKSGISDKEMYGTFNMGAGFAIFLPEKEIKKVKEIALHKHGFEAWNIGYVKKGPKQVIITPKKIVFNEKSLRVRE